MSVNGDTDVNITVMSSWSLRSSSGSQTQYVRCFGEVEKCPISVC